MLSGDEFGQHLWSSPQEQSTLGSHDVYAPEMPKIQTGKAHPNVPLFREEPLAWRRGAENTLSRYTAWRPTEGVIPSPWSASNRSSLILGGVGGSAQD